MKTIQYQDENITIYEFEDAKQIIAETAEKFRDDISAISRSGKNRNRKFYYNYPCAFDIETTTIRPGSFGYDRADGRPLGVPYLFQWNICGKVIMCRYIEEAMQIFNWLAAYFIGGERRALVIFDHNAGYEYGFFKDLWPLKYDKCFALDQRHPVTLEFKNGLIIRDSYKMSNMSLETLTKDWSKKYFKTPEIMDYKKIRMPWDPLDADTLLYSALDVLSLSDAMTEYLNAHNTGPWTRCPTSTSFIRNEYKTNIGLGVKDRNKEQKDYFNLLKKCEITPDIYAMELRQARGGNTHTNRKYTGQFIGSPEGAGVGHGDIISSYPTMFVCYPEYPIHYWRDLDPDAKIEDIMLLEKAGYCCLFDIVLVDPVIKDNIPVPYLPISKCRTLKGASRYSDNGRYITGAKMLEITIFGIEWPIIASQYNFSDTVILRGYYSKKGYLPDILRRFVMKYYEKKTQLKHIEGAEIEYSLAKSGLNSIYGVSYTKILRETCGFDEKGIFIKEAPNAEEELKRYQKSGSYFMCYAWGAMCATLGRIYLQKMIDCVGYEDFLYCDTDSVFFIDPAKNWPKLRALENELKEYQRKCGLELTYYDKKGRPHEIGGIDDEGDCSFMSYGAKKYITIQNGKLSCTIAGVPKKAGAHIIARFTFKKPHKSGLPKTKVANKLSRKLAINLNNFKLGIVFKGKETNKLCLWYNDDENIILQGPEGQRLRVYSNIAMLPVDYVLGLSDDYMECLRVEGLNELYSFSAVNDNMNEEYI